MKPKQAQVYMDGFYAGIVDDYNDWYERLYTAPGAHEITVFLDGYRTHTQHAYLTPDHTFKVKFQMEKLPAGEDGGAAAGAAAASPTRPAGRSADARAEWPARTAADAKRPVRSQ